MIGIISAMHDEIRAIHEVLTDEHISRKGNRTYYRARLYGRDVVMVFSRWGKVASATTATQLINDFDVDHLIFTGVAGSIKNHLNIGDIVIGKELCQYDMDASPLIPPFEIPLLKKTSFETDLAMRAKLQRAAEMFLTDHSDFVTKPEMLKFGITSPRLHISDIGSGDRFIHTAKQTKWLNNVLPGLGCVEMEGAAVAQVCYEYDIPFGIIRTISDKADDNAHIEFELFAREIASKYALGILKNYFTLLD